MFSVYQITRRTVDHIGFANHVYLRCWLLNFCRSVPVDTTSEKMLKSLRYQVIRNLLKDSKPSLIRKFRKAADIGNGDNLCQLVRSTNPQKSEANEAIKESGGSLIYSRRRPAER